MGINEDQDGREVIASLRGSQNLEPSRSGRRSGENDLEEVVVSCCVASTPSPASATSWPAGEKPASCWRRKGLARR
jgi:hypothetical protein